MRAGTSFGFVIISLLSLDTRRLHPVPPVPHGRGNCARACAMPPGCPTAIAAYVRGRQHRTCKALGQGLQTEAAADISFMISVVPPKHHRISRDR
jgi:hypothetical protein